MRFKKIVMIDIGESRLDPPYWKKLYNLGKKVVKLPKDSPTIEKELSNTDCLLVGFGIKVGKDYFDSAPQLKYLGTFSIAYGTVDILIPQCDFLSLNFALNKETEHFLNKKRIAKIKKGAVVINTSPMELVEIDALDKRLDNKDFTFILDHSDGMSEKDLRKLSKHKNCIVYPPIAYVTQETRIGQQESFIGNVEAFLKGKPQNVVN